MSTTYLVCPNCKSDERLVSEEVASLDYPARFTAAGDVEYTGESYEVMDEGTVFQNVIWCRACVREYTLTDLVPATPDEEG